MLFILTSCLSKPRPVNKKLFTLPWIFVDLSGTNVQRRGRLLRVGQESKLSSALRIVVIHPSFPPGQLHNLHFGKSCESFCSQRHWTMLSIISIMLPEFNLGMSFGKVKSGKSPEENQERVSKSQEIYIQNCSGILSVWSRGVVHIVCHTDHNALPSGCYIVYAQNWQDLKLSTFSMSENTFKQWRWNVTCVKQNLFCLSSQYFVKSIQKLGCSQYIMHAAHLLPRIIKSLERNIVFRHLP